VNHADDLGPHDIVECAKGAVCCDELGLVYDRIDAGRELGKVANRSIRR